MARRNDLGAEKTRGGAEEGGGPCRASAGGRLFLYLQQQLGRLGSVRKVGFCHSSTSLGSKKQRASGPLKPRDEGGIGQEHKGVSARHRKDRDRSKRRSYAASESAGEIAGCQSGGRRALAV